MFRKMLVVVVLLVTNVTATACGLMNGYVPVANVNVQVPQPEPVVNVVVPTPLPTPAPAAGPVALAPTKAFCQLGVTKLTDGVETQSLAWDPVQRRGYMDDALSQQIWNSVAYCRTEFPSPVTLLFDSVAGNPIRVDGRVVNAGNGRVETGMVFEWVYPTPSRSNGHAYIFQSAP